MITLNHLRAKSSVQVELSLLNILRGGQRKGTKVDGRTDQGAGREKHRKLVWVQLRDGGRQDGDSGAFSIVALMNSRLSAQTEQEGFSPSHPQIYCWHITPDLTSSSHYLLRCFKPSNNFPSINNKISVVIIVCLVLTKEPSSNAENLNAYLKKSWRVYRVC